jgi:pantoate--beta-alanine ligase
MSSRNRYLSPAERTRALILSRALAAARRLACHGETSAAALRAAMLNVFAADVGPNAAPVRLEYAAVVDPDTLLPIGDTSRGALVAVAAFVGATRLIDNLLLPAISQ